MPELSPYFWIYLSFALFGLYMVAVLPFPHRCRIVARRVIGAPVEAVWDALQVYPPGTSVARDADDPDVRVVTTAKSVRRNRDVDVVERETKKILLLEFNGVRDPLGPGAFQREDVRAVANGTEATLTFDGRVHSLLQRAAILHGLARGLHRVEHLALHGREPHKWPIPWALAASLAAIVTTVYLLGWLAGLLIVAMVVVHELGHYLAFRAFGHPRPRIVLVPFFGGIATGNRPHRTSFENAMVSLAGAAISAVVVALLLGFAYAVGIPASLEVSGVIKFAATVEGVAKWSLVAILLANIVGVFNLIQLLPLKPLDGGHILGALMHAEGGRRSRIVVSLAAFAFAIWQLYDGEYLIAGFAVIAGASALRELPSNEVPMSSAERLATAAAFAVTFATLWLPWHLCWGDEGLIRRAVEPAAAVDTAHGSSRANAESEPAAYVPAAAVWRSPALLLHAPLPLDLRWQIAKSRLSF